MNDQERHDDDLNEIEEIEEIDELDDEPIEAYCVSCREKVEIDNPSAVWTSQGRPGTRGECPMCGGTVFRMGRTHLHGGSKQPPKAIKVFESGGKGRNSRAAYIISDITQSDFADKLGEDLKKIGINVWIDDGENVDETQWAGGVHPALEQCTHLVVVLSSFALKTSTVEEAWKFFLKRRKPVALVQIEKVDPPDELRSRPRFDFTQDYKSAFRGLVEALSK